MSQLIPLALAPILTRLYTPEEFGILALFASVTAILTAIAAARYSVAILLPESDRDAVQVASLALLIASAVSGALLLLLPLIGLLFSEADWVNSLGAWLYLIPLAVFLGSVFESLSYYGLRMDKVGQMARANVLRASVTGGAQIACGLAGPSQFGLIGAYIIGMATGNSRLVRIYRSGLKRYGLRSRDMRKLARKYSKFPKFDLWGNLANILSYNLIIIGVGAIYTIQVLGQYSVAFRFTAIPSALLGVALGQVYFREAARRIASPPLAIRAFYKTTAVLLGASVVPMTIILLFGPTLFGLFFGSEWTTAGTYAAAMIPLVWSRFVVSPLSSVYLVYGRQRQLLLYQCLLLVIVLSTVTSAYLLSWSLLSMLWIQSSIMGSFYILIGFKARNILLRSQFENSSAIQSPAADKSG